MGQRKDRGCCGIGADPHAFMLWGMATLSGLLGLAGHVHAAHIHAGHVMRGILTAASHGRWCVSGTQNQPARAGHESDGYQRTTHERGQQ